MNTNALHAKYAVWAHGLIPAILTRLTRTQIRTSVIQRISVNVVYLFPFLGFCNHTMHPNHPTPTAFFGMTHAHGISMINKPVKLRQEIVVCIVYDGYFSLS